MAITAKIEKVRYKLYLCGGLQRVNFGGLDNALEGGKPFLLSLTSTDEFAVSHWVSPKRTRSYPYVRVYETLEYSGIKVTIIPVIKDEGLAADGSGDRDFIQWDTVSLMSLLNVYVVLSYYNRAVPSKRYQGKITKQQFSIDHLESQFRKLAEFKSSAIHWNMEQTESANMQFLFDNAMISYRRISRVLNVRFHSEASALRKISSIASSRDSFLESSRKAAESAQRRERVTIQPKEMTEGEKETITIKNFLGGEYYLTLDEFRITKDYVELVEAKHTKRGQLPSWNDIKDGLLKNGSLHKPVFCGFKWQTGK